MMPSGAREQPIPRRGRGLPGQIGRVHERGARARTQRPERSLFSNRFDDAAHRPVADVRQPSGRRLGATRSTNGLAPLFVKAVPPPLPEPLRRRWCIVGYAVVALLGVQLEARRPHGHEIDDRFIQSVS